MRRANEKRIKEIYNNYSSNEQNTMAFIYILQVPFYVS